MNSSARDFIEAVGFELGDFPPKLIYYGTEDPQPPNEPALVVIHVSDLHIGPPLGRSTVHALKRAVVGLIEHKPAHWLVETHSAQDFHEKWSLLRTEYATRLHFSGHGAAVADGPILLHLPHHGRGDPDHLSLDALRGAHKMLVWLDACLGPTEKVSLEPIPDERSIATGIQAAQLAEPSAARDDSGSADDDALDLARKRQQELLREERWLTATEVHERLGGSRGAPGANNRASRLRRGGQLLGVWDSGRFLYPFFQFYSDSEGGQLHPAMERVLKALPNDKQDPTGWRRAFWLFQPHALLAADQRPVDVLQKDPDAVIRAAQSTFSPGNENW